MLSWTHLPSASDPCDTSRDLLRVLLLDIFLSRHTGPEGLGILTVAGVPSFLELRREVTPSHSRVCGAHACMHCKALATTTTSLHGYCPTQNCTSNDTLVMSAYDSTPRM